MISSLFELRCVSCSFAHSAISNVSLRSQVVTFGFKARTPAPTPTPIPEAQTTDAQESHKSEKQPTFDAESKPAYFVQLTSVKEKEFTLRLDVLEANSTKKRKCSRWRLPTDSTWTR